MQLCEHAALLSISLLQFDWPTFTYMNIFQSFPLHFFKWPTLFGFFNYSLQAVFDAGYAPISIRLSSQFEWPTFLGLLDEWYIAYIYNLMQSHHEGTTSLSISLTQFERQTFHVWFLEILFAKNISCRTPYRCWLFTTWLYQEIS